MNLLKNCDLEISFSKKDIPAIVKKLQGFLCPGIILAFRGPMGSGKTTISRSLIQSFGVEDVVSSPTYSYLNRYKGVWNGKPIMINHLDLYRVKEENLEELGILDYIFSDKDITIIEWPDILNLINKKNVVYVDLDYLDDNKRRITIRTNE